MYRIVVVPEQLRALSARLQQTAADLTTLGSRLGGAMSGLDWETRYKTGVDGMANDARSRANALASQAETMARYLTGKARAFEEADHEGARNLEIAVRSYWKDVIVPVPAPAPALKEEPVELSVSWQELIQGLDDWLMPIDWIKDHKEASRVFDRTLKDIGRLLNHLTGRRGHIKMMAEFSAFLKGATDAVGFFSNILHVKDMNLYFAGQLTNAEIARKAIETLIRVPIINKQIADWLVQNMPDPNGHWQGLAPTVE